jgi:hypothetical protein
MGREETNNYGNNTVSNGFLSDDQPHQCGHGEWADGSKAPQLNF